MDPLDVTKVLSQAQIPPPHSPWHVLPPTWQATDTIISSSNVDIDRPSPSSSDGASEYKTMLRAVRRFIEEDGTSMTLYNTLRLYIIHNGTLLQLSNQTISPTTLPEWWRFEMVEMVQSALDIGRYLMNSRSRNDKEKNFSLPVSHLRSAHDDYSDVNNNNYIGANISDHYYNLIGWLLGRTDDDKNSLVANIPKSIPLGMDKGDFKGCPTYKIPIFTFAMISGSPNKHHTNCIPFALPCYEMWTRMNNGLKYSPNDWYFSKRNSNSSNFGYAKKDMHLDLNHQKYPWDSKKSKVLWRGSSTGGVPSDVNSWRDLRRFQLVQIGLKNKDIMDFGFTEIIQGWHKEPYRSEIESELPRCEKGKIDFTNFMKYKAVLDINGNSWSSRFGHLMCLNSVVLKVETKDLVNYFEFPGGTYGNPELIPWKHYVPVHKNLSNLVEVSKYVLDPKNTEEMSTIVANANEWCQHKMTVTQFAIDTLWMILNYVDLLYFHPQHEKLSDASFYNEHELSFEWMEQFVHQKYDWEPAIGDAKTVFDTHLLVKAIGGKTFQY